MLNKLISRNSNILSLFKDGIKLVLGRNMSTGRESAQQLADKICAGPKAKKPVPDLTIPSIKAAFSDDVKSLNAIYTELKSTKGNISDTLDYKDPANNTPLIWAADAGSANAVEFLANIKEVDISQKGFLGNTALARAARHGHYEIVKMLLEAVNRRNNPIFGANSLGNIHNDKLQYPMHFAAFQQHEKVVELMITMGLDTKVKDRKARTPLEDTKSEIIKGMIMKARGKT